MEYIHLQGYFFQEKGGFDDIKWHFIGNLQKNKVNNLCSKYKNISLQLEIAFLLITLAPV